MKKIEKYFIQYLNKNKTFWIRFRNLSQLINFTLCFFVKNTFSFVEKCCTLALKNNGIKSLALDNSYNSSKLKILFH